MIQFPSELVKRVDIHRLWNAFKALLTLIAVLLSALAVILLVGQRQTIGSLTKSLSNRAATLQYNVCYNTRNTDWIGATQAANAQGVKIGVEVAKGLPTAPGEYVELSRLQGLASESYDKLNSANDESSPEQCPNLKLAHPDTANTTTTTTQKE